MWSRGLSTSSLLLLLLAAFSEVSLADSAAEETKTTTAEPCTATSTSGFYDLRKDTAIVLEDGAKNKNGAPTEDYFARGWDYPFNFTMNICAPVIKPVKGVVSAGSEENWKNISAYYNVGDKVYSLGQQSTSLVARGRKISLSYLGGSPCEDEDSKQRDRRHVRRGSVHPGASYKYNDHDDETEALIEAQEREKADNRRRKSATLSFICDHDMMLEKAVVSFISTPDGCAYFFDVRSQHACAGLEPHKPGSVGPGGVFAIIFFIAVLVYVVGGVFYQRTVAHARGWRQLPNYSLWAGIWNFISDIFVILTSSCSRCMPGRRGYRTLSISPNGRGRTRDDENRLIDQLDEEWDD